MGGSGRREREKKGWREELITSSDLMEVIGDFLPSVEKKMPTRGSALGQGRKEGKEKEEKEK